MARRPSLAAGYFFALPALITTDIAAAAEVLRAGGLVAIPTETVYGLASNALNEAAVAKIFAAKNRPSFDPLILHQSSAARIFAFTTDLPPAAAQLAEHCWPGPLTLVLNKQTVVPDLVSAGLTTVAVRVPQHPVARQLLELLDFPLAAPSANPFGYVSPTTAQHVADQLGDRIDLILDGGPCQIGLESTIVGFPDGVPTVYRKGGLPVETLEQLLGHPLAIRTHSSSQPTAPGMLSRHYSPGVPLDLWTDLKKVNELPPHSAVIGFGLGGTHYRRDAERQLDVYDLSPTGSLEEAAQQLFSVLRQVAKQDYVRAAAVLVPERGLGRAINDRLRRAAAEE